MAGNQPLCFDSDSPEEMKEPHGFPLAGDELEVLEYLGEGATGTVYRARHKRLDRPVAVKVMHCSLAGSDEIVQRFQREKIFSGWLAHPGIVKTYYAGITGDGLPFLVMDYLGGVSLARLIETERLQGPRFFALFEQIIDALIYLHEHDVVHRDLKPSNIYITRDGDGQEQAVIIDFGLSRLEDTPEDQRITKTGAVMGTSYYMSPEQCKGLQVDYRSDIYSLGCIMFETLTGAPPFVGDSSYQVMFKQLNESISGLAGLKRLPRALAEVIAGCLQKEPDKRTATMAELKTRLASAIGAERAGSRLRPVMVGCVCIVCSLWLCVSLWSTGKRRVETGISFTIPARTEQRLVGHGFEGMRNLVLRDRSENNDKGAIARVNRWMAAETNPPQKAYVFAADVCSFGHDYQQALVYAQSAVKHAGTAEERVIGHYVFGRVLQALRRNSEARVELAKALNESSIVLIKEKLAAGILEAELRLEDRDPVGALQLLQTFVAELKKERRWQGRDSIDLRAETVKVLYMTKNSAQAARLVRETKTLLAECMDKPLEITPEFDRLCDATRAGDDAKTYIELCQFAAGRYPELSVQQVRFKQCALEARYMWGEKKESLAESRKLLELQVSRNCSAESIASSRLFLAGLFARDHDYTRAVAEVEQVLETAELNHSMIQLEALVTHFQLTRPLLPVEQHLAILKSLERRSGHCVLYYAYLTMQTGELNYLAGDLDAAEKQFERAFSELLSVSKERGEKEFAALYQLAGVVRQQLYFDRGELAVRRGHLKEAREFYRLSIDECRTNHIAERLQIMKSCIGLARCYRGMCDLPGARRQLERALGAVAALDPRFCCQVLVECSYCESPPVARVTLLQALSLASQIKDGNVLLMTQCTIGRCMLERNLVGDFKASIKEANRLLQLNAKVIEPNKIEMARLTILSEMLGPRVVQPSVSQRRKFLSTMGTDVYLQLLITEADWLAQSGKIAPARGLYQIVFDTPPATLNRKYCRIVALRSFARSVATAPDEAANYLHEAIAVYHKLHDAEGETEIYRYAVALFQASNPDCSIRWGLEGAALCGNRGDSASRNELLAHALKVAQRTNNVRAVEEIEAMKKRNP